MKDIKWILFFVIISVTSWSQTDSSLIKDAKGKTLKKLGKSALKQHAPSSAIAFLEAYVKKNPNDAEAKYLLASAYYEVRDYDRAQKMYLNAYNTNKKKVPEALYYHAQMLKSNARYDSAKLNFQKFKKEYKGSDKVLKRQAGKEIAFCDSIQKLVSVEKKIIVQHLNNSINKVNAEGAPVSIDNDKFVFSSLRTDKIEYRTEEDSISGMKRKLYYAVRKNNEWEFAGEYGDDFNGENFNTGNACFSPDRKRVYFTRCRFNNMNRMVCAIYVSEKNGDNWSEPVKLPKPVNNKKYTSTMPSVTNDLVKGNDLIYFVSDRKGSKGGLDIWYTVYDKKKKEYKQPRNAGSKINTSQDEMSPYFDNDTRTLYFSSEGLGGLGGFDVYRSTGDGKKFTGSENLGQPVNSGADDIYYSISTKREEGFFVSNRKGGNALKNATCCDDIYWFKNSEYIHITLKGNVSNMLDDDLSITNADIEVYIKDKKTQQRFLVKKVTTDKKGDYTAQLEAGQEYVVVVKKDDFLGSSEEISTVGMTKSQDIVKKMKVIKKPKTPQTIPNIEYEVNRADLSEASKAGLDKTALKLLLDNPEVVVEIQAHTDSKGSESSNLKLSQKRAENVVNYLVSKGIAKERLKAKGFGESEPLVPNDNPDGTDNPANRAKNRRVDFKIVGVVDPGENAEEVEDKDKDKNNEEK